MKKNIFLGWAFFSSLLGLTQVESNFTIIDSSQKCSFRGLSIINEDVLWVSGSKGTIGRSIDGGKSWEWTRVMGFENRDFRDIEAFNEKEAVIIAIAEPAQILRTEDGGKNWTVVFTDSTKGMFLDAMDFSGKQHGIVIGDPINGKAYLAITNNGGKNWQKVNKDLTLESGEAFFAASGSNIYLSSNNTAVFVTGGKSSRFWKIDLNKNVHPNALKDDSGTIIRPLPLNQGKETTGANAILVSKGKWYVCGGDFNNDKDSTGNFTFSSDDGKSWQKSKAPPLGYRSCMAEVWKGSLISCGTSGIDIYVSASKGWTSINKESFHVCGSTNTGKTVFFAGGKGRIARMDLK